MDTIKTQIQLRQPAVKTVRTRSSNKMIRQWVPYIGNTVGEIMFS